MKKEDKIALERYLNKLKLVRSSGVLNAFESPQEKADRIERAKKDVKFCVEYYFPHYATAECADFQVKWANKVKKNKRFVGFAKWPRGHAKSVWNNIIIPFWLWINDQDTYFVAVGQNFDRASQLLEDIRAEFEANSRIIADFGVQHNPGNWEDGFFVTKGGFIGQAIGLGQSCRGLRVKHLRPTLMNCDDLETRKTLKNERIQDEHVEWVETELLPAMDGEIERLLISNNWFAPVMFLKKLYDRHPDWHVDEVIACDPVTYEPVWKAKYTKTYWQDKEKKMGRISFRAEYLHIALVTGKVFKPDDTQWTKLPNLNHFEIIGAHWDVAYAGTPKSDYNAIRIWGLKDAQFYYITGFVKQCKMRAALDFMCQFQKELPKTVIVHWRYESQFWNGEVQRTIDDAQKYHQIILPLTKVDTPKGKKYDRILTLEPYFQNGRIFYNEKMKSHNDSNVGLYQLYAIEPGYNTHDDAPDADHQIIEWLGKHIKSPGNSGKWKTGKYKRETRF